MVVKPVTSTGDPAATTIWVPPGRWIDYFTGTAYSGASVQSLSVPLSQMPVLVRAGAIIPTQPYAPFTAAAPKNRLILTVFPGARGKFKLYDDGGKGFGYAHGRFTWTTISHAERRGSSTVTIGAARGRFPDAPRRRSWQVRLLGIPRPRQVRLDGRVQHSWSYDAATHTLMVGTGSQSTSRPVTMVVR